MSRQHPLRVPNEYKHPVGHITHHNACACREEKFKKLEQQNAILVEACENIKKHIEIVVAEGAPMSVAWRIATEALAKAKDVK